MQAPKKKTSKSKRNMRRSHHFLESHKPNVCGQCGETVLRHRVCLKCGTYRGKAYIEVEQD